MLIFVTMFMTVFMAMFVVVFMVVAVFMTARTAFISHNYPP